MTHILIPFASEWSGKKRTCSFKASAGDTPLAAENEMAPVYTIPDGAQKVTVTATPTDNHYWKTTVELLVKDGGDTIENADLRTAWVKLTPLGGSHGAKSTMATIRVSRFKDVTTDVVNLLNNPPAKRSFKIDGEWVTMDTDVRKQIGKYRDKYGKWPPDNWNLASTPAHYLNASEPVKSGVLNFAPDTSVQIGSESVALELAGVTAPKLFAVVWPHDSAIYPAENAAPTPFLLFIRQGNKGNKYDELGQFVGGTLQPYPYNFDYAVSLFECLHYAIAPTVPPPENAPFWRPYQKGVPNQVAKARVAAVTVIPCNSFDDEFGVLNDTEQTGEILQELQAFMFSQAGVQDPPDHIGDTVIAAFSSGNVFLDKWLNSSQNLTGNFLTNVVRAVYFLEPILDPNHTVTDRDVNKYIPSALNWANSGKGDKRIRLYMRFPSDAHKKLLSPGSPPSATPYFSNSSDRFTAAVVTEADWTAAFTKVTGVTLPQRFDWRYSHHIIAGTMLTHALWQGDFKRLP